MPAAHPEHPVAARACAPAEASSERAVQVLAVSSAEDDIRLLRHIFSHSNWIIHTARGCGEAAELLRRGHIPIVLCDFELADGNWRDMLRALADLPEPTLLIVASRTADEYLWAEVLNLGGYDVLMKPYEPQEVIRVVSLAWLHWKNLRERRRLNQPLLAAGT